MRVMAGMIMFWMFLLFVPMSVTAQDHAQPLPPADMPKVNPGGMDNAGLQKMIEKLDPEMIGQPGHWQLRVEGLSVNVITDERADRMRIMIPIKSVEGMSARDMLRILQANFDSALDARYAVAKGILWGTFIHPLSPLTEKEFLLALGETVNIVLSYGSTYSSGVLIFGGGDSGDLRQKKLLEDLIKKGEVI